MPLPQWAQTEPFSVHHPDDDAGWDRLRDLYYAEVGSEPEASPLHRTLAVARELGCATVVAEHEYYDADYRSEYSAFWSRRFSSPPPFAHRLHFFGVHFEASDICGIDPDECEYLGYAILRPVPTAPVARALLRPPTWLREQSAVLAEVHDNISFFGVQLRIQGVPFSEQDRQYVRCSHAALWTCHYILYRQRVIGRLTTADLIARVPSNLGLSRALPSAGLNPQQMQTVMTEMGLPPLVYHSDAVIDVMGVPPSAASNGHEVGDGRVGTDAPLSAQNDGRAPVDGQATQTAPGREARWRPAEVAIACRYLNSGLPVVVSNEDHSFLLVGYVYDTPPGSKHGRLKLIVCDDQHGPYEAVDIADADERLPWTGIMVPQPPNVFLSAEMAENLAYATISNRRPEDESGDLPAPLADALPAKREAGDLRLRTFLLRSRDYKAALAKQQRHPEVVTRLRLTPLSHWVHVVEVHDAGQSRGGPNRVVAEFVFDSTCHDEEPTLLAVSYPEFAYFPSRSGTGESGRVASADVPSWLSQLTLDSITRSPVRARRPAPT